MAAGGPFLTARLVGYERKKLFIFTLLLFALSNLIAAGASNIWVMALARFIPALRTQRHSTAAMSKPIAFASGGVR